MAHFRIMPTNHVAGDIFIPGDKSISHRAVIFASLSSEFFAIENLCCGDDVLRTITAMQSLGVSIQLSDAAVEVNGVGLHGLSASDQPIHCGNSGTLMRLLCGLLSAQSFNSVLIGDASLTRRPMLRIAEPLRLMGAKIDLSSENTAPIHITGNQSLHGIDYRLPVPSAQVKSGILLASLYAEGETHVQEKIATRDHTEKMRETFSKYLDLQHKVMKKHSGHLFASQLNKTLAIKAPAKNPRAGWMRATQKPIMTLRIPGDISSAAFFIVAAAITPNSHLVIRDVGINPLRTGIISILKLMGAAIEIRNERLFGAEPVADLIIRYAPLHGITIPQEAIANAIDEFPVIFIAAAIAQGNTILRGASELRVKESDRISVMCEGLKALGVSVEEYDDGVMISGNQTFLGGRVDSHGDHRVAMAFAVAGCVAKNEVIIEDVACVKTSFPEFAALAKQVGMGLV